MTKKNIAIVGSGIAALGCAYHLQEYANITIFDKNNLSKEINYIESKQH